MAALFSLDRAPTAVQQWLAISARRVEQTIDQALPLPAADPGRLVEAMRYAALGPGKRLRPAMLMAACTDLGGNDRDADLAAAAIEMLHAYTLVHDDLPAMDDDEMRRGRPTAHIAFGEDIAILAGDALLTESFALLARLGPHAAAAVAALARLAGGHQLLAGQALDLTAQRDKQPLGIDQLEQLHAKKTGALFAAAAALGGICANAPAATCEALEQFGNAFGIAFQYADDIDDGEHQHLAAQTLERMQTWATRAYDLATQIAPGGQLHALGQWARTLGT